MKERFLRLTKQTVNDMFDDCNRAYFNNEVPRPKVIQLWTPHRKVLGMVRPAYNRRTGSYSSILHISRLYRWTEENLRKVIVHEMIHLYIGDYLRPLRWWERIMPFLVKQHDSEFIAVMNQLNDNYGLGIQTRFKEMREYLRSSSVKKSTLKTGKQ